MEGSNRLNDLEQACFERCLVSCFRQLRGNGFPDRIKERLILNEIQISDFIAQLPNGLRIRRIACCKCCMQLIHPFKELLRWKLTLLGGAQSHFFLEEHLGRAAVRVE
ncbi:hypothetical protein D3C78_1082050 [compost metagenome]